MHHPTYPTAYNMHNSQTIHTPRVSRSPQQSSNHGLRPTNADGRSSSRSRHHRSSFDGHKPRSSRSYSREAPGDYYHGRSQSQPGGNRNLHYPGSTTNYPQPVYYPWGPQYPVSRSHVNRATGEYRSDSRFPVSPPSSPAPGAGAPLSPP